MAPQMVGQFFSAHNMDANHQYPDLSEVTRIKPSTAPTLTPYLGLRSRLSQVWFNRWTLLLVLIIVRVYISVSELNSDIDSAEREALSACTAVERSGSAMASMPHYMAQGVNELSAQGIEGGVRALQKVLLMSITAIQEIMVFVINMLVQTYVCLITLAISSSIGVVLDTTEKIGDAVNNTIGSLITEFDNEISGLQDNLDSLIGHIKDTISNFFGGNLEIPTLKLPALDKLKEFHIPTGFDKKLQELRDGIPDFKEVKDAGQEAIRVPFQLIQVCWSCI